MAADALRAAAGRTAAITRTSGTGTTAGHDRRDELPDALFRLESVLAAVVGRDGSVVRAGAALPRSATEAKDGGADVGLFAAVPAAEHDMLRSHLEHPGAGEFILDVEGRDRMPRTFRCFTARCGDHVLLLGEPAAPVLEDAQAELVDLNNRLAILARDHAREARELERTRAELEESHRRLQTSYWHLRKIQEALPVCMICGKVKSADAQWRTVADYLKENEIFLSHGYCPECAVAQTTAWKDELREMMHEEPDG